MRPPTMRKKTTMTDHDSLNDLVTDMGERNGLALTLDARGSCAIQYDLLSEVIVTGCDGGDSVLLHSPLSFLDERDPLTQLRRCLEFSTYGAETAGGAVGLDPDGEVIVFWRRITLANLDSRGLEKAILAFTVAADKTRAQLTQPRESETGDAAADETFAHHAAHIRI